MLNILRTYKWTLVYLPLITIWGVVFFFTSLPGNKVPNLSISDKLEHFIAFGFIGGLLYLTFLIQNKIKLVKKYTFVSTFVTISLYAALDEIHQLFIPRRSCDIIDWLFDLAGAISVILLVKLVIHYWN